MRAYIIWRICLKTGDLIAVSRRLLVMAYEDIGLANPHVGAHVFAATEAAKYSACLKHGFRWRMQSLKCACLKNPIRHIKAFDAAIKAINEGKTGDIPMHLRDAHYAGAKTLVMSVTSTLMTPDRHFWRLGKPTIFTRQSSRYGILSPCHCRRRKKDGNDL